MGKNNWGTKTDLEKAGLKVAKLLQNGNFQAFWVGGIFRNILLKRESDNVDIATDATPDQIEQVLNKAKIFHKPVGKKFGSILAIVNGFKIEITTFRAEGRYSDNRHPDRVEFIKDHLLDAKRRDFTINALYFDPIKKELLDPTNFGQKDLKAKILRFVGDPRKRIDEDALRMLRGARLATQLEFKLEKNSFAAIKTRAKYIQGISGERVKAELDKILLSKNRGKGLKLLDQIGLLKFIIPEFEKLKQVFHHSKKYHLEGSVAEHLIKAAEIVKIMDLDLIYAALFHDIGKAVSKQKVSEGDDWIYSFKGHVEASGKIFEKFATRFKFSQESKKTILSLIAEHDNRRKFLESRPEEQIKFMLKQRKPELLVELWRVDSGANYRYQEGKLMWGTSYVQPIANKVLKEIKKAEKSLKLAKGDLIMKYTKLKPGKELGNKIKDVKAQIILGNIHSERDLKNYLTT